MYFFQRDHEMTIFHSAYDVTATKGFNMKRTNDGIEEAVIHGSVPQVVDSGSVRALQQLNAVATTVPHFDHPIYFGRKDAVGYVVFDARPYGSVNKLNGNFEIRNLPEYDLLLLRAKLDYIWNTAHPSAMREVSNLPLSIYAMWLSSVISHKYTLDGEEQMRLQALAGYFYTCLFTDDTKLSDADLNKAVGQIAKATNISADTVFQVVTELPVLANLEAFCEAAYKVTGSVRLKELNQAVLLTIMGGTWQGNKRVEYIGVALEHPPTWLATVFTALRSRQYKHTQLARTVEINNRGGAGDNYIRAVIAFTDERAGD